MQEELLKEALVPLEEQPYDVPGNWVWTELGYTSKLINGDRGKNYPSRDEMINEGIPFINAGHLEAGSVNLENMNYISEEKYSSLGSGKVVLNDILYCLRGTLGKTALVNNLEKAAIASSLVILRPNNIINTKYLFNYLVSPLGTSMIKMFDNGSAQPNLSAGNVKKYKIPIPPLNEQKRIADKVERLLGKINQAKQLIEEAEATFELRRAAILDKAFRGELTKKWREEHIESVAKLTRISLKLKPLTVEEFPFDIPDSWSWYKLGEILKITSGGTPSRSNSEYYKGDIPWIKTGEIKWNDLFDTEEKISEEAIKNSSAKLLPINTVLVAMYGQGLTRGRAAILHKISACNQAVCALLPNENVDPKFLFYFFMEGYHRFRKIAQGGNQENLSASLISTFVIPIPPIKEQLVIVDFLDELFAKENDTANLISFESYSENIINSILNKAFRGELGTNDNSEKSELINY